MDRRFRMDLLFLWVLMCRWVLGHHLRQPFHLDLLFLTVRLCRLDLMCRKDLLLRPLRRLLMVPLFLTVQRSLMDRLPLRDLMCHLVLWVLGSHWLRLSPMGQPSPKDRLLLWGLMCHLVLGHHLRQQFHLVPLFLTVQPFRMDLLPLRDLMCHLVLWVLGPRWLRLCRMDLLLRLVPMFPRDRLGLGRHLRQPFLKDRLRRLDLMFRRVLWVLGPHWLRLSPMGQPRLRDLKFRWVLWVLGPRWLRLSHLDLLRRLDLMCRLDR
jgi:hypothetical protein